MGMDTSPRSLSHDGPKCSVVLAALGPVKEKSGFFSRVHGPVLCSLRCCCFPCMVKEEEDKTYVHSTYNSQLVSVMKYCRRLCLSSPTVFIRKSRKMGTAKEIVQRRIFWWSAAYLGAILAHIGAMLAYLEDNIGPCLGYLGAMLVHLGGYVGPSWGYIGPIMGPMLVHVDPSRA